MRFEAVYCITYNTTLSLQTIDLNIWYLLSYKSVTAALYWYCVKPGPQRKQYNQDKVRGNFWNGTPWLMSGSGQAMT